MVKDWKFLNEFEKAHALLLIFQKNTDNLIEQTKNNYTSDLRVEINNFKGKVVIPTTNRIKGGENFNCCN